MSDYEQLEIGLKSFQELKQLHKNAVENKKSSFFFKEKELVTDYAKYMIQYLEPKFKEYGT